MKNLLTAVGSMLAVAWAIAVIALPVSATLFFLNNL